MTRMKTSVPVPTTLFLLIACAAAQVAQASWVTSSSGYVSYTRTVSLGTTGVRLELGVSSSASHSCGTQPTVYYFDSTNIGPDATKSIIAVAIAAMTSGAAVTLTYDCTLGSGGYGWGTALSASN